MGEGLTRAGRRLAAKSGMAPGAAGRMEQPEMNPFWSEKAWDEAQLKALHPRDLPEVEEEQRLLVSPRMLPTYKADVQEQMRDGGAAKMVKELADVQQGLGLGPLDGGTPARSWLTLS